jgi:hypothetical protein
MTFCGVVDVQFLAQRSKHAFHFLQFAVYFLVDRTDLVVEHVLYLPDL